MREIRLTKGKVALVDDSDYESVSQYNWYTAVANGKLYAARTRSRIFGRGIIYLHRWLMDAPKGIEVDHRDGDGLNCQRYNMRLSTLIQNRQNHGKNICNTSGHKGVSWSQSKQKWMAQITANRKVYTLGMFVNKQDAIDAYKDAARKYHGEFSNTD